MLREQYTSLSGDHSEREPPNSIPNLVVKPFSADDSVGFPHVKVGHRQAFIPKPLSLQRDRGFFLVKRWQFF